MDSEGVAEQEMVYADPPMALSSWVVRVAPMAEATAETTEGGNGIRVKPARRSVRQRRWARKTRTRVEDLNDSVSTECDEV